MNTLANMYTRFHLTNRGLTDSDMATVPDPLGRW